MTTPEHTMPPRHSTAVLSDEPVSLRVKLAAAWTSLVLLYAYVDILNFFTPGVVRDILHGKVFTFALSETFSAGALTLLAVPIFMVVLSAVLPARAARLANLIVAGLYLPVTAFNVVGATWLVFYGLGVVLELIVLGMILRYAWVWPRATGPATS